MITKPLLVLKKQLFLLSVLYTVVLTVLSLATINTPEGLVDNKDKVFHTVAYLLFTVLWFLAFSVKFKINLPKALGLATFLSTSFGVLMEFLQQQLTQNRQADFNDVIANTIGTIIAIIIIVMFKKTRVKN